MGLWGSTFVQTHFQSLPCFDRSIFPATEASGVPRTPLIDERSGEAAAWGKRCNQRWELMCSKLSSSFSQNKSNCQAEMFPLQSTDYAKARDSWGWQQYRLDRKLCSLISFPLFIGLGKTIKWKMMKPTVPVLETRFASLWSCMALSFKTLHFSSVLHKNCVF